MLALSDQSSLRIRDPKTDSEREREKEGQVLQ
jgi:hypothetical protein